MPRVSQKGVSNAKAMKQEMTHDEYVLTNKFQQFDVDINKTNTVAMLHHCEQVASSNC